MNAQHPAMQQCYQCSLHSPRPTPHQRLTSATVSVLSRRKYCERLAAQQSLPRLRWCQIQATPDSSSSLGNLNSDDTNQLQTALNQAIAAEDYILASKLRDQIQKLVGSSGTADWRELGVPEWLADRIERMGYKYATGEKMRCGATCKYCFSTYTSGIAVQHVSFMMLDHVVWVHLFTT